MKKLIIFLALILIMPPFVYAQSYSGDGEITTGGVQISTANEIIKYTVATLPAGIVGQIAIVTDGSDSTDCTGGAGTDNNICYYDGSAWSIVSDAPVGGSDNLGNHTATQDLEMGVYSIDCTANCDFDPDNDGVAEIVMKSDGNLTVTDDTYAASWNSNREVPTKNDVYDKVETLGASGGGTTDAGTVVHVTTATDDFAVGGTDSTAPIYIDESDETILAEGGYKTSDGTDKNITFMIIDRSSTDPTIAWNNTNEEFQFNYPINVVGGSGPSVAQQGMIIAESGGDTADDDIRMESDTETHLFFIGASDDSVKMGDSDGSDYVKITSGGVMTFAGTADIDLPNDSVDSADIADDTVTYGNIVDSDQTDTKCIYFEDPTAADDFKSIWANKTANDFQVTEIWAESDQTVTFMLQLDDGSPADCDSVDLAPAIGEAEDTALNSDCLVAAGEKLDIDLVSVANTPTWVSICFTGNWVD